MVKDVTQIDDVEDMGSSSMPQDDAVVSAQEGQQPSDVASSATQGEKEVDTLSLVRDVGVKKEGKTDAASPAEGEEGSTGAAPGAKERDDENFTDVPFHKHPRFRELLTKAKAYEVDAKRYENVETYLAERGLSGQEAFDTLDIVALARTNAVECWQRMRPFVESVLKAAGEILPPELEQAVANQQMTVEQAYRISRSEAAASQAVRGVKVKEQIGQYQQSRTMQTEVRNTISSWQTERETRDPNFADKLPLIEKEILWLQSRDGNPTTAAQVKEQLDKAYKNVNASYRKPAPAPGTRPTASAVAPAAAQRREIRPVTGGQARAAAHAGDMDTLSIVRANRRGAAR